MKGDSRSALWKRIGFFQKNTYWTWCAVNPEEKNVIFQVWVDHYDKETKEYLFMSLDWVRGGQRDNGLMDAIEKINLLKDGYKLYATFATAVDTKATPRDTKSINDTAYSECTWRENGDNWYCKIVKNMKC